MNVRSAMAIPTPANPMAAIFNSALITSPFAAYRVLSGSLIGNMPLLFFPFLSLVP